MTLGLNQDYQSAHWGRPRPHYKVKVKVAWLHVSAPCDPMDYAIYELHSEYWSGPFLLQGSSQPRDCPQVSHIAGDFTS